MCSTTILERHSLVMLTEQMRRCRIPFVIDPGLDGCLGVGRDGRREASGKVASRSTSGNRSGACWTRGVPDQPVVGARREAQARNGGTLTPTVAAVEQI